MLSEALKVIDDVVSKGGKFFTCSYKETGCKQNRFLANETNQFM